MRPGATISGILDTDLAVSIRSEMCFDAGQWAKPAQIGKHRPKGFMSREEVTERSRRKSTYFHGVNVAELELTAAQQGVYLASNGTATIHKIYESPMEIGASKGEISRWVFVESTSAEYHGYPITKACFDEWMKSTRECCHE
jgi:hypothetical protein